MAVPDTVAVPPPAPNAAGAPVSHAGATPDGDSTSRRPQRAAAVAARKRFLEEVDEEDEEEGEGDADGESTEKRRKAPKAPSTAPAPAPKPKAKAKAKAKAAPPPLVVKSPVEDLHPDLQSLSKQVCHGLRAWASIALRSHISRAGTVLRSKKRPTLTPLPSAAPSSIVLTRIGVLPLLHRAILLGHDRAVAAEAAGQASVAAAARDVSQQTAELVQALQASTPRALELGVTPLLHVGHGSLAALLHKHQLPSVPGQVVFTGGGLRVTIPVVRFVRRMEKRADAVSPGSLFNWDPRGNSFLRPGGARGRDGAGLRKLSRNWKDWLCCRPGAYDPEGVPKNYQESWDNATSVHMDPGILLCLTCSDGRALSKARWYKLRQTWADFVPTPAAVRQAEAGMGKGGGGGPRAPGLAAFSAYVAEFHRVHGTTLSPYYGSSSVLASKEYKADKLRSLLSQLLHELAPRPQVRCCAWLAQAAQAALVP